MTELTELEIKQQAVVDTKAAYDAKVAPHRSLAAYYAWSNARIALSNYLKEHGYEHSI